MNARNLLPLCLVVSSFSFVACNGINELSDSPERDMVEGIVIALGSSMDDVSQSGSWTDFASDMSCSRVAACSTTGGAQPTGIEALSFDGCGDSDGGSIEGDSESVLTVNPDGPSTPGTPDCDLDVGETAVWKSNTLSTTLVGGFTEKTTSNRATFDTTTIGGGVYITRADTSSLIVTVSGVSVVNRIREGTDNYNVSVASDSGSYLTVSGSTTGERGARSVSGTIRAFHNAAEIEATYTLNSVTWGDADCCFPTSGTMDVNYSGAVSGSGTVEFSSSCGELSIQSPGSGGGSKTLNVCS